MINRWVPYAQWVALFAMTLEHFVRFAFPDPSFLLVGLATLIGRLALPLFAAMVAWHLFYNTRDSVRYAYRLLLIALVSQVPYFFVVDSIQLNIVFTLSAGVIIASFLPCLVLSIFSLTLLLVGFFFSSSFEYGFFGLLLVPAFYFFYYRPRLGLLPLLFVVWSVNDGWLYSAVGLLAALVVVLVRVGYLVPSWSAPRVPRRLWLFWYPFHFLIIFACIKIQF